MTAWSRAEALTYAHVVLAAPLDPSRSGTVRLARALLDAHDECVRLRISESDRLALFPLVADRNAARTWPGAIAVIERLLETSRK